MILLGFAHRTDTHTLRRPARGHAPLPDLTPARWTATGTDLWQPNLDNLLRAARGDPLVASR